MAQAPNYPLEGHSAVCGNCAHWHKHKDPSPFGICGNPACYSFPISGPHMLPNVAVIMMATTDLASCTRWEPPSGNE